MMPDALLLGQRCQGWVALVRFQFRHVVVLALSTRHGAVHGPFEFIVQLSSIFIVRIIATTMALKQIGSLESLVISFTI